MTELANKQYLDRHRALRRIWLEDRTVFGVLDYNQQREVHAFYAPATDWSDQEMIEHRHDAQKLEPSLPHRASRGFLQIEAAFLAPRPVRAPVRKGKRNLRVIPIAKPEIETRKLTMAFLQLAEQQIKTERENVA